MKVINAFWEEKNLGVTTAEILIDIDDDVDEIVTEVNKICKEYVVCKVPSDRSDILYSLQNNSFIYTEDQIEVEHDLHEITRNRIMQRLYDSLEYRVMTETDIDYLYDEISRGMFSRDRISLDPYFDNKLASQRYINWINDLLKKGAIPYLFMYKNDPAGFIVLNKIDENTYRSVLGGGYEKYRKSGLGVVLKEMEIVSSLGGKRVVTSVSSNNANQVKALIINGFVPIKIEHVLVKHN